MYLNMSVVFHHISTIVITNADRNVTVYPSLNYRSKGRFLSEISIKPRIISNVFDVTFYESIIALPTYNTKNIM